MSKELPFQMAIRELEAKCAFQASLLERAKERMSDAAVSDAWAEQWVSDFASLSGKGE